MWCSSTWLVVSRLKLVRWGCFPRSVAVLIGLFIVARVGSIGGANAYPAEISLPQDMERDRLRLGMPGTATFFADNVGVIGRLMSILAWASSYMAYL
jgi:hypothetical protein